MNYIATRAATRNECSRNLKGTKRWQVFFRVASPSASPAPKASIILTTSVRPWSRTSCAPYPGLTLFKATVHAFSDSPARNSADAYICSASKSLGSFSCAAPKPSTSLAVIVASRVIITLASTMLNSFGAGNPSTSLRASTSNASADSTSRGFARNANPPDTANARHRTAGPPPLETSEFITLLNACAQCVRVASSNAESFVLKTTSAAASTSVSKSAFAKSSSLLSAPSPPSPMESAKSAINFSTSASGIAPLN
mmetsp:Transcript_1959/g.6250  ORF Transcript_1959/g.6250 Transcript_1959/m.6250 type:complete len:255 (+) Transcript_1959:958-1722(+)